MANFAPRRIVFTGAECTGKSTLAKAVAKSLNAPFSLEFVREFADQLDRAIEKDDLEKIALGQLRNEDSAVEKAQNWVVHDTNLFSSILYAQHYFDVSIDWVDELFVERVYDHYFLCEPDIPWVEDPGQRESSYSRERLHRIFTRKLDEFEISYRRVRGDLECRINAVLETLRQSENQ